MEELVSRVREQVAGTFGPDAVAHDLPHLDRVHALARALAEREGGDPVVVGAAAYVHDYHRILEKRTGDPVRPEAAAGPIAEVLAAAGLAPAVADAVLACVACTDVYGFAADPVALPDRPVEGRVVRDADVLDALGAVGIARAFMYGGALGEPMWVPDAPLQDGYREGRTSSVVHHFHEKLLRLEDDMWTATGAGLARERTAFMRDFLARLETELA
ncbi:hypothetical protein BJF78_02350 [Pseudonocardia sp. CNS-139]|nr:hypothetical protein BJF78_02350 [Pseudonocardia sp. CNS-139]